MRFSLVLLISVVGAALLPAQSAQAGGASRGIQDDERARFLPKDFVRQYAETPASYVTDLRPLIEVLATRLPESGKGFRSKYSGATVLTDIKGSGVVTVSEDQAHKESSWTAFSVTLYPSLQAAEIGLARNLATTQASFAASSPDGQTFGELSFSYLQPDHECSIRMLRRNAVVSITYQVPTDVSKRDIRPIGTTADPSVIAKCQDLAQSIDNFLTSAH